MARHKFESGSPFEVANERREKATRERVERQNLTSRLLALYGERPNAEVAIGMVKDTDGVVVNVVVEFDRLLFAFPRLTNDAEFLQVFSRGYNYRLEFPTEPQRGAVTLVLESCPEDVHIKSEEEFDDFCERSWKYVTTNDDTRATTLSESNRFGHTGTSTACQS